MHGGVETSEGRGSGLNRWGLKEIRLNEVDSMLIKVTFQATSNVQCTCSNVRCTILNKELGPHWTFQRCFEHWVYCLIWTHAKGVHLEIFKDVLKVQVGV
jgi:hypothetical protein